MRDGNEPPAGPWVDDRLVRRLSQIAQEGLFAIADIPEGAILIRYRGRMVSSAELTALIAAAEADPSTEYVDTITVSEDRHLVMPPNTQVHYANHSCDPNLWHVGPYAVAARRDIRPGEELTIDYATHSGAAGFEMDCTCGSELCRGRVTSDDWRLPELQERYRGHWVPALEDRIAARAR